jgi:hypothetical protein
MALSAKERLAALEKALDNQKEPKNFGPAPWKKFYQFWKMPVDSTAIVRFLPDKNQDNPRKFLVENFTHKLTVGGKTKVVPCLSMYGEACPCCELSARFYAEGDETQGLKYYKKRSYIAQIVLIDSPFEETLEDGEEEAVVKLIDFGPKVFKCIQAGFKSGDLEEEPYFYKGGYNFRIKKTQSGKWPDYGTSSFAPKATDLDDDLIDLIKESHFDLSEHREKQISRAQMDAYLLADRTGQELDANSGSNESSGDSNDSNTSNSGDTSTMNEATTSNTQSAVETSTTSGTQENKAQSVLEKLRARAAAKKTESNE